MVDGEQTTELTHLDHSGAARMVDISDKDVTSRMAEARGIIRMRRETLALIQNNALKKGDVLGVARLAGIMAAKRTSELVPLCHLLPLSSVLIEFQLQADEPGVEITARAKTDAKTGVEMEALAAVSVAALTIYDMCKAVDRAMCIGDIRVTRKTGGKSGAYESD